MTTYATANYPLKHLLEKVDLGQLVLPEDQLDFVWTKRSGFLGF